MRRHEVTRQYQQSAESEYQIISRLSAVYWDRPMINSMDECKAWNDLGPHISGSMQDFQCACRYNEDMSPS
jgi:hypothetical protein